MAMRLFLYLYEMTMTNWGELGQGRSGHQS